MAVSIRSVFLLALWLGFVQAAGGAVNDHGLTAGGADTCLGCHNDASMRVIFRTAHGRKADPDSPMASLQCETCHGPGAEHSDRRIAGPAHPRIVDFAADSTTPAAAQNAVCEGCHERDVGLAWHGSVHERNDATCVSCHKVHTERDPVSLQGAQAGVCFDCHRAVRADTMKPSTHPIRFDAMTCTDCHAPHGAQAPALLNAPTTNELCLGCHAEYRGPMLFDHPPVSEDCGLCHAAHGSIHPALLVRREPLLCQSCHSRRGHPSLSFTDDGLAGGRPSAMLLGQSCSNCHVRVHGSNHPSGFSLMR
ncbi:MAG: DmsE family decaheme c-type cytochrome [Pseudomonadales bacterium]|jgi:DmsE family decaheme c-type cytochrome